MKYKKYVMMFLAGTMALTPAAPMAALAEDTVPAAESEAEGDATEDAAEETAEESEAESEVEAEEAVEEAEVEETEAEETEDAAEEAEQTEEIAEIAEGETAETQTMLQGATEAAPVAEGETAQGTELAVGTYSVDYELVSSALSEANADVKAGKMIVDVSEGADGQRVYTYYMTVKNTKIYNGMMDFWLTKIAPEDGEEAEVTAHTNITVKDEQKEIPQVFKFVRTSKEDSLNIGMSTCLGESKPYSGTLVMNWSTATGDATIPGQETDDTDQDLAVGVYSVEYGIKKFGSDSKPTETDSMAAGVKDGKMIIEVSKDDNENTVYTYYMTVQQTQIYGIDAKVTALQLDGEDAEVYAMMEDKETPKVFRFRRTAKEDFLSVTSTINPVGPMPAMAVVMDWGTAESGATIPGQETDDTNQDLAVGVYSVEYNIMSADDPEEPSMLEAIKKGNMIVDVSEDENGKRSYTYYMSVGRAGFMGVEIWGVKNLNLDGENGTPAEVYSVIEGTEKPNVFRFTRKQKESLLNISATAEYADADSADEKKDAIISMQWDTAKAGARIPGQETEEDKKDLEVGVYSVEYGLMKATDHETESMAAPVKNGNMIVKVSDDGNGGTVYTYYMTVQKADVMGQNVWVTGLQLDGVNAKVHATMEEDKEIPKVFSFQRTTKEKYFDIVPTIVRLGEMPAMAVVMDWETATTNNGTVTIPEGNVEEPDTPDTATIPAPIITPAKTEAENGSEVEVSIATEKALTYGEEVTINDKTYKAVDVEIADPAQGAILTGYIDRMAAMAWQSFRVVFDGEVTESGTVNVKYLKVGSEDASAVADYMVAQNLPVVQTENGYKLTLYVDATNISQMKDSQYKNAEIYYTTDGATPTAESEKYNAPFKVTGNSETKTIKAIAVLEGKTSAVSEQSITFKKSSNTGKHDEITDGKYWMDVQFYNADKDAVSMGDSALENNRRALVTVKNGTATIEVATNPIYRDGIVSGIGTIKSADKDVELTVLDTNTNKEYNFEYVERFEIKLSDLTKKSVTVKFTVPNTPMESMYPDGVPARLMLDFNNMTKANDNASLKPNDKTASRGGSSGEAFDAEDKDTGVKLAADKYVFDSGVELKVTKLTEAKDKETAETLLKKQADRLDLFEIKVMKGDKEVTPSGTVKISIPVRKGETATKLYRITPADKKKAASATELEFTRSKDGKYLELEVKELGQFAVVYAEAGEEVPVDDATETPAAEENRTDISGHWAESMIQNAMQKGIMTGVGNGDFAPNAAMTRGMLITALGRMEGVKAGMYQGGSFADVKEDDYFAPFVAWAVVEDIASGMSETEFAPNVEVTREQLAVFLYNYAQKKGIALTGESKTFTDADSISDWAKDAVAALTKAGLLNGRPDGSFDAKGKATRAEVATVLVKLAELTAEK